MEKGKGIHLDNAVLKELEEQLEKIRYGSVTLVIQDGKVVQIDTSTKTRLR